MKKKIAIITGASSGLGSDFARELDRQSLDEIWLIARREDRLLELASTLKNKAVVISLDLARESSLKKLGQKILREKPDIRYLVNNAGFGSTGSVYELDSDFQIKMIDLNVRALTAITLIAIPWLSKNSSVIQIASSAGFAPMANFAVYAATKSFVLNFTLALSEELKDRGILVNAVCPGPVKTEFFQSGGILKIPIHAVESIDVVRHALKKTRQGKIISVYGLPIKIYQYIVPLIPVKLLLWATKRMKKQ